jgi:hypothetical protein
MKRNGDAVLKAAKPDDAFKEIGLSGLNRISGFIQEEFLRDLKGQRALKIFREMADNDPIIGAMLFAMKTLIRRVQWNVQPGGQDQESLRVADLVETCMSDMSMSWDDVICEICTMFVFGYAPLEIVYKLRQGESNDPMRNSRFTDGMIGWRKLPIRSPESRYLWEFDENGGIQAFSQMPPPDFMVRTIPIEKLLLFRTTTEKNNPEGKSLLRNCYRPWYLKKNIEQIEAIGIERDLAGLPVGWVPAEILSNTPSVEAAATKTNLEQIIRNIRRDEQEGVLWPLSYDADGHKIFDLTLLSTGGGRQFDTTAIITRYDQRIAQSVMADVIMIGHQKAGSFALTESKIELFASGLKAFVDGMADVFNRFAVPRLLRINGLPIQNQPILKHGSVEQVDLDKLGTFVQSLAAAGAPLFPDEGLENYLREVASLPQREDTADGGVQG